MHSYYFLQAVLCVYNVHKKHANLHCISQLHSYDVRKVGPLQNLAKIRWATRPQGQTLLFVAQVAGPPLFCGPLRWATVKAS